MVSFGLIWQTFIFICSLFWSAIFTNVDTSHQIAQQIVQQTSMVQGECDEWYELALNVGWKREQLVLLGDIIWEESRCQHDVVSSTNDYGLTQINWAAHGSRLTSRHITKNDLLNPAINLREALWIANYAQEHYGCWSQPWYMSGTWC